MGGGGGGKAKAKLTKAEKKQLEQLRKEVSVLEVKVKLAIGATAEPVAPVVPVPVKKACYKWKARGQAGCNLGAACSFRHDPRHFSND